ncbi:hypothetical protein ACVAAS_004603 [Enterobacter roggenkampii]
MNHPEIHVKDWIDVANHECVVQRLLPPGSPIGVCTVVLNKTEPTWLERRKVVLHAQP